MKRRLNREKCTETHFPRENVGFKYRNGGCFGFEPNSQLIYSAYNFSNRIRIAIQFGCIIAHGSCFVKE